MTYDPQIHELLEKYTSRYNHAGFVEGDPISVPRMFSLKQDIEIAAFWTSVITWGRRASIIQSAKKLMQLMDHAPYDFIMNHEEKDRIPFTVFKHRTFMYDDTLYFLEFLQQYYRQNDTLETAFLAGTGPDAVKNGLSAFYQKFFSLEFAPQRTRKHIPTPDRKSACKRLNMFLRWMVRNDQKGVDLGLWNNISPSQLMIPLDVHVERIGRNLGLLTRKQVDWLAVEEVTANLRLYDPDDPVKYDFALFGFGVMEGKEKFENLKIL